VSHRPLRWPGHLGRRSLDAGQGRPCRAPTPLTSGQYDEPTSPRCRARALGSTGPNGRAVDCRSERSRKEGSAGHVEAFHIRSAGAPTKTTPIGRAVKGTMLVSGPCSPIVHIWGDDRHSKAMTLSGSPLRPDCQPRHAPSTSRVDADFAPQPLLGSSAGGRRGASGCSSATCPTATARGRRNPPTPIILGATHEAKDVRTPGTSRLEDRSAHHAACGLGPSVVTRRGRHVVVSGGPKTPPGRPVAITA